MLNFLTQAEGGRPHFEARKPESSHVQDFSQLLFFSPHRTPPKHNFTSSLGNEATLCLNIDPNHQASSAALALLFSPPRHLNMCVVKNWPPKMVSHPNSILPFSNAHTTHPTLEYMEVTLHFRRRRRCHRRESSSPPSNNEI